MRFSGLALTTGFLVILAACGERPTETQAGLDQQSKVDAGALLDAAVANSARPPEERARDQWRHPKETLQFFGVEPSMVVIEVWPGGGWYTRILAPYLNAGGGAYRAALPDPSASASAAAAADRFRSDFETDPKYGSITVTTINGAADPGAADVVLSFRNVHNWIAAGVAEGYFEAFYASLKPGGVLGVVEHRADETGKNDVSSGYVKESAVKELAVAAGFEFVASSEINANPLDTKDHPFGVWTLPPTRRSALVPGRLIDPGFDRAKYDAIGESDRMTLKFVKPMS